MSIVLFVLCGLCVSVVHYGRFLAGGNSENWSNAMINRTRIL